MALGAFQVALGEGETSGVIEFSDQFYILRADSTREMDEERFRENLGNIKMSLLSSKQQAYMTEWYVKIKGEAEIEDYRSLPGGY